ncbi:MAG TPA: hypothetical protein VIG50_06410 [Vicinamibacteria bacterium]
MRTLAAFALGTAVLGADGAGSLRVRASAVVAPCVEAAARAFAAPAARIEVEVAPSLTAGPADVIVGSGVELTRALEGGAADANTDLDVARVPWVIQVRGGGRAVRSAADLTGAGIEVAVPDSPAAYDALRWARAATGGRARPASERELRAAAVVVVPLSLAGPGERVATDVPPLIARAALGAETARRAEAQAFLAFLGSEPGQKAFAACRAAP